MHLENIPCNTLGILEIGDARFAVMPTAIDRGFDDHYVLTADVFHEVFSASNAYAARRVGRNPEIKNVIFNDPATVIMWSDGTKTVVKCQPGDTYSKETGLALCIAKKYLGNKGNFNEVFKKWIPEEDDPTVKISVENMRKALDVYCQSKAVCSACPLESPVCRCGCGTYFDSKKRDGSYDMSDAEIRAAYKVVFMEGRA